MKGRACAPCALVGSGSCGGVACEEVEGEENEEKEESMSSEMLFFFFFLSLSVSTRSYTTVCYVCTLKHPYDLSLPHPFTQNYNRDINYA